MPRETTSATLPNIDTNTPLSCSLIEGYTALKARAEIPILMKLKPSISVQEADRYYSLWCFDKDFRDRMTTALRLAGLREEKE